MRSGLASRRPLAYKHTPARAGPIQCTAVWNVSQALRPSADRPCLRRTHRRPSSSRLLATPACGWNSIVHCYHAMRISVLRGDAPGWPRRCQTRERKPLASNLLLLGEAAEPKQQAIMIVLCMATECSYLCSGRSYSLPSLRAAGLDTCSKVSLSARHATATAPAKAAAQNKVSNTRRAIRWTRGARSEFGNRDILRHERRWRAETRVA